MDQQDLLDQLARRGVLALIPQPRDQGGGPHPGVVPRKWHSVREVAELLGYSVSKTKMLVATREIRSLKDGKHRRILPEWVDEYVARKAADAVGEISA